MYDRLFKIIDYYGITANAFCNKIGASNSFLTKRRSIGSNYIEIILQKFPEISPSWLVLGEGDMLRGGKGDPLPAPLPVSPPQTETDNETAADSSAADADSITGAALDHNAILDRYKELLYISTDTDLIQFLGVHPSMLNSWRARRRINLDFILSRCRRLDVRYILYGVPSVADGVPADEVTRMLVSRIEDLAADNALLRSRVTAHKKND